MKLIFGISIVWLLPATRLFAGTYAWSYILLDEWPDTCKSGTQQSPIALSNKLAKWIKAPPLRFGNYGGETKTSLENNGHTVEVQISPSRSLPTLSGGFLRGKYVLNGVHFHWDSEHTINDKRYPLEAHYVHYKKKYGSMENATRNTDGIVVLGVMFEITNYQNNKLNCILESMTQVARNPKTTVEMKSTFDAVGILPRNKKSYYTYSGSLTTPECSEVVTWIVFENTVPISRKQLYQLSNVFTDTGEPLSNNYRSLQNLNDRPVFYISGGRR